MLTSNFLRAYIGHFQVRIHIRDPFVKRYQTEEKITQINIVGTVACLIDNPASQRGETRRRTTGRLISLRRVAGILSENHTACQP